MNAHRPRALRKSNIGIRQVQLFLRGRARGRECGTEPTLYATANRPHRWLRCRSQATASCCRQERWWCCVKKVRERHAVREMKEDPSEPSCRGRLQTAMSCFGQKAAVVNVMVKRRDVDHVRDG